MANEHNELEEKMQNSQNQEHQMGAPLGNPEAVAAALIEGAKKKVKVLVVDDELVGLKYFHLPDNVKEVLGDLTSPEVGQIWEFASNNLGFRSLDQEEPRVVSQFLSSDSVVSGVLLAERFRENVQDPLRTMLQHFYGRFSDVSRLRGFVEAAFPVTEFDLNFLEARPSAPAEMLKYDLVILDLVLPSSASAVDEMIRYLGALGKDAFPERLPCLILMSSHPELIEHQIRFSTASNISAAGLLILPKAEISKSEFGATGLELSYRQLDRQREVAHQIRVFMRTWTDALESAKEKAAKTIWNLDAAAMQEIHLVAHNDHDPYDEYLNALISREYLWHVESAKPVTEAIAALDHCFKQQFKKGNDPAVIEQRFIAPFVQSKNARALISHFTWTGLLPSVKLADVDIPTARAKFSTLFPFGAVLAPPEIKDETECLVHITQQCDLNQQRDGQSVQFAVAVAKPVKDNALENYNRDDLVARGLSTANGEFNLVLVKGKQLALPQKSFVRLARLRKLEVVGRLRHDIAMHFLLATANHMTRWASQKVDHIATIDVALYLHGDKFPNGHIFLKNPENEAPLVVQLAQNSNKKIYFQDNTSIRIALWIVQNLAPHYDASTISAEIICNQLSIGLKNNECLSKFLHLKTEPIAAQNIQNKLNAANAPKDKVTLVCVSNPPE